jgi:hypothetical protein
MALHAHSTVELQAELKRRERNAKRLVAKRNGLLMQVAEIDAELAALGKSIPRQLVQGVRPVRHRARNDISLPDAIAAAMEIRARATPKEAAELVRGNGYKTTSKSFNMMVSNAMAKDQRFKRISRGQYERIA